MRGLLRGAAALVIEARAAPAAVVVAGAFSAGRWQWAADAAGRLGWDPGEAAANGDTVFDLASLTKPVLALTVARLVRAGRVDFGVHLGDWLEEAIATPSSAITVEQLLSHRAGLEAHRPFFAPLTRGEAVDPRAVLREAASAQCGGRSDGVFDPLYSDLGYILLGEALARHEGVALDALVEREVTGPLGIANALASARRFRCLDPSFDSRVAPTEVIPWRSPGRALRGVVHDENAWALGGAGMCGHAGLFATAWAVGALGQAVLDAWAGRRPAFLTRAEIAPLVSPRPGGTMRAGFDGKSREGSSAGDLFGPRSVGHLGFTGTSLWLDPDREWVGVLLTNRVHPTRASNVLKAVRPRVYDAIARWAGELQAPCDAPASRSE